MDGGISEAFETCLKMLEGPERKSPRDKERSASQFKRAMGWLALERIEDGATEETCAATLAERAREAAADDPKMENTAATLEVAADEIRARRAKMRAMQGVTFATVREQVQAALATCTDKDKTRVAAYAAIGKDIDRQTLASMLAGDPYMTDILESSGLAGNVTQLIQLAIGLHVNQMADKRATELGEEKLPCHRP